MPLTSSFARLFIAGCFILATACLAQAQIANVTSTTATPFSGAGHDYIQLLNETVSPANGSVNLRINLPVRKQLGVTLPLAITYNSAGIKHIGSLPEDTPGFLRWLNDTARLQESGWSETLPVANSYRTLRIYHPLDYVWYRCYYFTDYTFTDPTGERHSLGLSYVPPQNDCNNVYPQPYSQMSGGDPVVGANATSSSLVVNTADGTQYHFSGLNDCSLHACSPSAQTFTGPSSQLPDLVEDRNGNILYSGGAGTFDHTVTTVTAGGRVYGLQWQNVSGQYWSPNQIQVAGTGCGWPAGGGPVSGTGIQYLTLPNGKSYQFSYDPVYGLLSKITYPTGATVTYTWGLNPTSESVVLSNQQGIANDCKFQYSVPAVSQRLVSFDGVNTALEQDFSYQTTWNVSPNPVWLWSGKTTTVVTKDCARTNFNCSTAPTTTTKYTYVGWDPGCPPNDQCSSGQIPLENTTIYYDGGGAPLRTITKTFVSPHELTSEQTKLENNRVSEIDYTFSPFCSVFIPSSATYDWGSGAKGALLRRTVYSCQNYGAYRIGDAVQQAQTFSGTGTLVAETDYSYDQTALTPTSGVAAHDYTNYPFTVQAGRRNPTSVTHCIITAGACASNSPKATYTYDDTGQLLSMTDACGNAACGDMTGTNHTTMYSYADSYTVLSGGQNVAYTPTSITNTFLTKVTDPLGHSQNSSYDFNNGQLTISKEQNNQTTTLLYNDSLARLKQTNYPDGGVSTVTYNDNGPSPTITTSTKVNASPLYVTSVATIDGLGHVTQTALTTDPDNPTYTAAAYDGLGHAYKTYNPTRCSTPTTNCGESTWGVTTTFYDALSRTTQITEQDGQVVTTSYSGNCSTVTDEAARTRKSCSDAIGRLIQVFEQPSDPNYNYETDYAYDALNNLLTVNQKGGSTNSAQWRTRTFAYDSLSRLTSATNPESGLIAYSYDANGNLTSKTSPAPNQTGSATVTLSYCYDALNRLTSKAYTAQSCPMSSPVATYLYDQSSYNGLTITNGIGRRTGMTDQAGSEAWSYDSMGRVLTEQRTTKNVTKSSLYSYNLDGSLATIAYPAAAPTTTLTYVQGGAGRHLSAGNASLGLSGLAYSAHYAPNGTLCSLTSSWGQTFMHNYTFNNRFQVLRIQDWDMYNMPAITPCTTIAPSGNGNDELDLTYSYTDSSGHNNGNVANITNNVDWHRTQSFTYDSLNRITSAWTAATNQPAWQGDTGSIQQCWAENYSYDPWGNLLSIAPSTSSLYTGCTQESGFNFTGAIGNNNRIAASGYTYDSPGNLIAAPPTGTTYTYDAENHLTSTGGLAYLYDGDGKRIGKAPSGTPTQPNYLYWYGAGSNILQETDGAGNFLFNEFYFNGTRVSRQESDNFEDHFFLDALGNTRGVYGDADPDGGFSDYYPFGAERPISPATGVSVPFKFTGKERDSESGLDNFDFRYNSSSLGRFMSPDPLGGYLSNPQSLNRYAYVLNNPLNLIDPFGLQGTCVTMYSDKRESLGTSCGSVSSPPDIGNLPAGIPDTAPDLTGASSLQLEAGSISPNPGAGMSSSNNPGLDSTQFGLGLLGAIPGPIGTGANLINAGISLYRGQYGQAALNVAFAIPFVGTFGRAAQLGEGALEAAKGVEGIYEFVGSTGRIYVGQSGNIGLRLAQHLQSGALLEEGISSIRLTEVAGGSLTRQIAEQLRIEELGGVGNLQNVRNAIGAARDYLMVPFRK